MSKNIPTFPAIPPKVLEDLTNTHILDAISTIADSYKVSAMLSGISPSFLSSMAEVARTIQNMPIPPSVPKAAVDIATIYLTADLQQAAQIYKDFYQAYPHGLSVSSTLEEYLSSPLSPHHDIEQEIRQAKKVIASVDSPNTPITIQKISSQLCFKISDKDKLIAAIYTGIEIILDELEKTTSMPEIHNLQLFLRFLVFLYTFISAFTPANETAHHDK